MRNLCVVRILPHRKNDHRKTTGIHNLSGNQGDTQRPRYHFIDDTKATDKGVLLFKQAVHKSLPVK